MNALLPIEAEFQETATREEGTTAAAYQATAEARRDRRCHITCWNCQKKGHYQSECRAPRSDSDGKGNKETEHHAIAFMAVGKEVATAGVANAQTDNPLNLLDSVSTMTAAMITHIANATLYLSIGCLTPHAQAQERLHAVRGD